MESLANCTAHTQEVSFFPPPVQGGGGGRGRGYSGQEQMAIVILCGFPMRDLLLHYSNKKKRE